MLSYTTDVVVLDGPCSPGLRPGYITGESLTDSVVAPLMVALIDQGHLAAERLGTHRRLKLVDVLAYTTG